MRLFTAIEIPLQVKSRLRAFVDRLRPTAKLSWCPVDNLHVTTKFIGEWPNTNLSQLKDVLASVPRPGPVEIVVRGLGWFPNTKNPRVFWAGIEVNEPLRQLAVNTEQALAAIASTAFAPLPDWYRGETLLFKVHMDKVERLQNN